MRRFLIIPALLLSLCFPASLLAQEESVTMEQPQESEKAEIALDTLKSGVKRQINNYSMIGVSYGASMSTAIFNPVKNNTKMVFNPRYFSVTFTKYGKMYDQLPWFALMVGAEYGHEGFSFEADKETGNISDVDGATWCEMEVIEFPAMTQVHVDVDPVKFMADVGIFGGWRRTIERTGPSLDQAYAHSFHDYEHKFDYGLEGGVGFALMFAPVEIHFNVMARWSWASLYDPDYASRYYYRFAYPLDLMATVGLHFQLSKRYGRTNNQLRRQAHDYVYGTPSDNSGQGR